jgi:hypothetical protein
MQVAARLTNNKNYFFLYFIINIYGSIKIKYLYYNYTAIVIVICYYYPMKYIIFRVIY